MGLYHAWADETTRRCTWLIIGIEGDQLYRKCDVQEIANDAQ
jgi:hypothetical protein